MLKENNGPRCAHCDRPGLAERCHHCKTNQSPLQRIWAPYLFGGPLQHAIHRVKFAKEEHWLRPLSELILNHIEIEPGKVEFGSLVPVPLGAKRLRERGFNQSAVLARALSRHWRLPLVHALKRQRETLPQSSLSAQKREENMQNAFTAVKIPATGPILLVDDVISTGATLRHAAKALAEKSKLPVFALALAHSDPQSP